MSIFNRFTKVILSGADSSRVNLVLTKLRLFFSLFFTFVAALIIVISYNAVMSMHKGAIDQYTVIANGFNREIEESVLYFTSTLSDLSSRSAAAHNSMDTYALPGFIANFQIDSRGEFSSSLLPSTPEHLKALALTPEMIKERYERTNHAFALLRKNQLLQNDSYPQQTLVTDGNNTFLSGDNELKVSENDHLNEQIVQQQEVIDAFQSIKQKKAKQPSQPPKRKLAVKATGTVSTQTNDSHVFRSFAPEPFRVSLLASGELLFYRQIWQQDATFIQGAIMQKAFISELIEKRFERSALSAFAQLDLYHNDKVWGAEREGDSWVGLTPLAFYRLPSPLDEFTFLISYRELPKQESIVILISMAGGLLLAIGLGLFALYKMLASQHKLMLRQQGFISSVSHELKTPVTSIKMYGEMLQQGWLDQQKQSQYFNSIVGEAERLSRLIDNVLQASQINRNSLQLNIEVIQINALTNLITTKTECLFRQSGFTYTLEVEEDLTSKSVSVDRDAFAQIMINLVDNAIKYSNENSKQQVDIKITRHSANQILVQVRDYGIGVEPQELDKIFGLFYRVGDELTRSTKGTGLGLALVKELMEQMKGSIYAKTRQPGTEFVLIFPLNKSDS